MASARRLTNVIWNVSASASRTIASSVSTRSPKSCADVWASVRATCSAAKTVVVNCGGRVVGQADQHALVGVAERPRCTTADVEETLDLLSDDDGDGEGAADAFGVDRLGVLRRHRGPRDTFGRPPGPAADHGMPTDAQARHDAKAPIGVAAVPNDVPGREGAVGVAHR
jgi:hypothetical protein